MTAATRYFQRWIARPSKATRGMPFGLRTVGHARVAPGEATVLRTIDFVHLLWTVAGEGKVLWHGRDQPVGPDHVACYLPGMRHRLTAAEGGWEYRWLTLDGLCAGDIVRGFGFDRPPFRAGACPVRAFDDLRRRIRDVSPVGEKEAARRAFDLLVRIAKQVEAPGHAASGGVEVEDVVALIGEHLSDSAVGVRQISIELGLDRSVMTRKFTAAMGVSPKEFQEALRLQRVLALLKGTDLSVKEISRRAGYSNANYMAKSFRRRMGRSPTEFRGEGTI